MKSFNQSPELDSTVFDDDFGCTPIVYSSDECDAEGKNIQHL